MSKDKMNRPRPNVGGYVFGLEQGTLGKDMEIDYTKNVNNSENFGYWWQTGYIEGLKLQCKIIEERVLKSRPYFYKITLYEWKWTDSSGGTTDLWLSSPNKYTEEQLESIMIGSFVEYTIQAFSGENKKFDDIVMFFSDYRFSVSYFESLGFTELRPPIHLEMDEDKQHDSEKNERIYKEFCKRLKEKINEQES